MTDQPEWVGTTEAGRLFDVLPSTVRAWQKKGLMPNVRTRNLPNGHIQFKLADLNQFASVLNGEGKEPHVS